jgi:hypothetical protein
MPPRARSRRRSNRVRTTPPRDRNRLWRQSGAGPSPRPSPLCLWRILASYVKAGRSAVARFSCHNPGLYGRRIENAVDCRKRLDEIVEKKRAKRFRNGRLDGALLGSPAPIPVNSRFGEKNSRLCRENSRLLLPLDYRHMIDFHKSFRDTPGYGGKNSRVFPGSTGIAGGAGEPKAEQRSLSQPIL